MMSNVRSGSLGPIPATFQSQFDLVIGNPPWTAIAKGGRQKAVGKDTSRVVCERLGPTQAKTFDFPDTNPDLPFVWRARDGVGEAWGPDRAHRPCSLAVWIVSAGNGGAKCHSLRGDRSDGHSKRKCAPAYEVLPAVDAPWCVPFATNEKPEPLSLAAFQFISPALLAVDAQQTRFRIDWPIPRWFRFAKVAENRGASSRAFAAID